MPRELKPMLWIDTETTGLAAEPEEIPTHLPGGERRACHITEIAAVLYDPITYRWIDQANFLVHPGDAHWEPKAREMSDYTKDPAPWKEKGVHISRALARIVPMFKGATPAGQNPAFDMRFLRAAVKACPVVNWPEMDYHLVDLASMAWPLFVHGQIPGLSLRHTSKLFGVPDEQSHRAMRDVCDSVHVYQGMMRLYEPAASMAQSRVAEWAT